ncbi:uncharacterized protein YndB with AHSA1/START domain [Mumia flava]|uniref:Uncharacterized protein YndB with AHSA1/START domain n=1 Tax=Mumia flava TaxID=1348852 RepID=A0A0B2AYE7_9ACTN|nr:SRPBCC domain-containing protein [Mumia flava]PJJ54137.1 uncharacterized protein YndB with AHSA1/START domain [Mumia flava]
MKRLATGRLRRHEDHHDLVYSRIVPAATDRTWAALTDPDETARWYGRWRGDGRPGGSVSITMAHGAEQPARITASSPELHLGLALVATDDEHAEPFGTTVDVYLRERDDGGTDVQLVHHRAEVDWLATLGPGWDYYLDLLVAHVAGDELATWDAYYPSMRAYYETLADLEE